VEDTVVLKSNILVVKYSVAVLVEEDIEEENTGVMNLDIL
jgi:hypothetical protein